MCEIKQTDKTNKTKTNTNNINKLFASGFSTFIAEIITLPICTIKTVYQNNLTFTVKDTINHIYKQNGYKGFIHAFGPSIFSQILSTSSKYTIYEYIKTIRSTEKNDITNNSLNGMISGILGSIITHPIDVWKNYKQRNQNYIKFIKRNLIRHNLIKPNLIKPNLIKLNFFAFIKNTFYVGYSGSFGKNIILYGSLYRYTKLDISL